LHPSRRAPPSTFADGITVTPSALYRSSNTRFTVIVVITL
jgi:hypothetical protein